MSNTDLVMDFIQRNPGCTDSEIRVGTGVQPHQQVNQITRGLATSALIIRQVGADGMLHNYPGGDAQLSQAIRSSSVGAEVPGRSAAHRTTASRSFEWKASDCRRQVRGRWRSCLVPATRDPAANPNHRASCLATTSTQPSLRNWLGVARGSQLKAK